MSFANILSAVICWLCSLIFGVIALWAFKRKDPMHFWSGSTVRPEEITDIPSYNRANGCMWAVFTFCMVVTGILFLFSMKIGAVLLVITCFPGIAVLIVVYRRIYNKYKRTSVITETNASKSKTPKTVIIAITSISAIILIIVGVLIFYGEKDLDVRILDDRIEIKAMYGITIDFSEIADISLIDKSVNELDIGRRMNGYGGDRKRSERIFQIGCPRRNDGLCSFKLVSYHKG